jgi:hypothetical protein
MAQISHCLWSKLFCARKFRPESYSGPSVFTKNHPNKGNCTDIRHRSLAIRNNLHGSQFLQAAMAGMFDPVSAFIVGFMPLTALLLYADRKRQSDGLR